MAEIKRRKTPTVKIGNARVGWEVPVLVQSMTNTDTADIPGTIEQVAALALAGSEIVRVTVNNEDAAAAVPYIVDSINGRVYDGEFAISDLPGKWLEKQSDDPPNHVQFSPSSRLLKINGCPNERDCGFYDYVMVDGNGLKLINKWLLPQEFQ